MLLNDEIPEFAMSTSCSDFLDLDLSASPLPKYECLKNSFVAAIDSGRLSPGSAIPPEKKLAQSLGVARNTVRQALRELEKRGLLQRIHGRGTFVDVNASQRICGGVSRHHEAFALVVPDTRNDFYAALRDGFENAACEQGHPATVCSTENNLDKQAQIVLSLMDQQVAGVAIVPAADISTPAAHIRQLQQQDIPVVLCHRGVDRVRAPLLSLPYREIGRRAAAAAVECGHSRAAFITDSLSASSKLMEKGLRETMVAADGELPDAFVVYQEVTGRNASLCEQGLKSKLSRLCAHATPPSVIFTSCGSLAAMSLLQLHQMDLRVPDDISLIGFIAANRLGVVASRVTSVVVKQTETAHSAIELLDEMRRGVRSITDSQTIELSVDFAPGNTLGPHRQQRCS